MNKNNIVILICLSLMLIFCIISFRLFSKNVKLAADSKKQADSIEILNKTNQQLLSQSVISNNSLKSIVQKYESTDTGSHIKKLINTSDSIADAALKLNDPLVYQQASKLENEAFKALTENKFDSALVKFTQTEKLYPSYHMSYEISKLLKDKKENFKDPETQKTIKLQIINKLNWKAPTKYLVTLKSQVNG